MSTKTFWLPIAFLTNSGNLFMTVGTLLENKYFSMFLVVDHLPKVSYQSRVGASGLKHSRDGLNVLRRDYYQDQKSATNGLF